MHERAEVFTCVCPCVSIHAASVFVRVRLGLCALAGGMYSPVQHRCLSWDCPSLLQGGKGERGLPGTSGSKGERGERVSGVDAPGMRRHSRPAWGATGPSGETAAMCTLGIPSSSCCVTAPPGASPGASCAGWLSPVPCDALLCRTAGRDGSGSPTCAPPGPYSRGPRFPSLYPLIPLGGPGGW